MVPDIHQIVCRVVNDNSLDYGVLYPVSRAVCKGFDHIALCFIESRVNVATSRYDDDCFCKAARALENVGGVARCSESLKFAVENLLV